jgi:hypothetical protein
MKRTILGTLLTCAALSFMPQASFAAGFDGMWSVLVVTDSGSCDRAYRYEVKIANGQVQPAGSEAVTMSGAVSGNGAIKVSVGRGEQKASGSGRLSGKAGTGKWSGRGNTGNCSGSWSAERRS